MHVGAGLHELRGQAQRLGCRVRVLKAAGVRDERDVERLGDVRGELDVQLVEEVAQHLAGRRSVVDDQIDLAEPRVVVVVVHVDRERHAAEDLGVGDPALVGTVHGEQHAFRDIIRPAPLQLGQRHEPVLAGERRIAVENHDRVLAELVERELHCQQRAEGVAVGILVRGDQETFVATDRISDRSQVTRCRLGRVHR